MYYKYNEKELRFEKKIVSLAYMIVVGLVVSMVIGFTLGYFAGKYQPIETLSAKEKVIVINTMDPFKTDSLKSYLEQLNVKFADVVYAQAQLETGGFTSNIFRENNNLFGMKQAMKRSSTNKGEQFGHAYYDTWRESVLDYALYQCRYLSDITTRDEYLQYLRQNYAEDPNYFNKLLKILNNG
jgi:uncharacterized FlgJ-related protein